MNSVYHYHTSAELRYPELMALLAFCRDIGGVVSPADIWPRLLGVLGSFYDSVAIFVPKLADFCNVARGNV